MIPGSGNSYSNIWGNQKKISQNEIDAASGKGDKIKLFNRVKIFFSKGIWLSDSKIKKIGKGNSEQAKTINNSSQEHIQSPKTEGKHPTSSHVLKSSDTNVESKPLNETGNSATIKPKVIVIMSNARRNVTKHAFGDGVLKNKGLMTKFEAVQKLLPKNQDVGEIYQKLKEACTEENGVNEEKLGTLLDNLENHLRSSSNLTINQIKDAIK